MVSEKLASVVQLIANFNDRPSATLRSTGSTFSPGRLHSRYKVAVRSQVSNLLSQRLYSRRNGSGRVIAYRRSGCDGVPRAWCSSGCMIRQAVNNKRWITGSHMTARKGRRWRKRPPPIRVTVRAPRAISARQTAMSSILNCRMRFPLLMKRSLCFAPSFPTRSGPSFMARIRVGEAG